MFQVGVIGYIVKNPKDKNHQLLYSIKMNMCQLSEGMGNMFLKPFILLFKKHSNLTIKCPFKKGIYHLTNMNTGSVVLPIKKLTFLAKVEVFVFLQSNKKKRTLAKFDIFGEYTFLS